VARFEPKPVLELARFKPKRLALFGRKGWHKSNRYIHVIMSNHVHLVVQQKDGKLSDWIRDFKKFTSKKLLKLILENPHEIEHVGTDTHRDDYNLCEIPCDL
jgi:hypothetical protein